MTFSAKLFWISCLALEAYVPMDPIRTFLLQKFNATAQERISCG